MRLDLQVIINGETWKAVGEQVKKQVIGMNWEFISLQLRMTTIYTIVKLDRTGPPVESGPTVNRRDG